VTATKSLDTRRAELAAARAEVLAIYRPLLDAWREGLSANEIDARIVEAGRQAERPLRRFRRLKAIVATLEIAALEGRAP
jgi:hypothetical protein